MSVSMLLISVVFFIVGLKSSRVNITYHTYDTFKCLTTPSLGVRTAPRGIQQSNSKIIRKTNNKRLNGMKKKRIAALVLLLGILLTTQMAFATEPTPERLNEEKTSGDISPIKPEKSEDPDTISVTDIEIGEYEEEIEVDTTTTIFATVRPTDATDQTVTYHSSDPAVATVFSDGTVKGVSVGKTTISITAGNVTKKVTICVIVKGKRISLNQTYIVLKPDTSFDLDATLFPENATYKTITYKSLDKRIATVSSDGLITAHSCGTGTITVSSKDVTASVTVIVNLNTAGIEVEEKKSDTRSKDAGKAYPLFVKASEYPFIEPAMLKYCYDNSCQLTVQGENYQLIIDGWKIKNYNNPLKTYIDLHTTEQGGDF